MKLLPRHYFIIMLSFIALCKCVPWCVCMLCPIFDRDKNSQHELKQNSSLTLRNELVQLVDGRRPPLWYKITMTGPMPITSTVVYLVLSWGGQLCGTTQQRLALLWQTASPLQIRVSRRSELRMTILQGGKIFHWWPWKNAKGPSHEEQIM